MHLFDIDFFISNSSKKNQTSFRALRIREKCALQAHCSILLPVISNALMKLSDIISKKPPRFFCVLAVAIFFANSVFATRTVTMSSPATESTFGLGTRIIVYATAAGCNGGMSKIVFTVLLLSSQTDFSGQFCTSPLATCDSRWSSLHNHTLNRFSEWFFIGSI